MGEHLHSTQTLWIAMSDELRLFLRSRLPSDADTDDLLQDVFVRVQEKLGTIRHTERIESWVYQIARNAVTDFYRRRRPRPDDPVEVEVADTRGKSANLNRAVAAWLSAMTESLPDTVRAAVRMYEIEQSSQADIAKHLGISLTAAKSRVQRGRRELANLLRSSCQLDLDRRGNVIACKPTESDSCEQMSCSCDEDSPQA